MHLPFFLLFQMPRQLPWINFIKKYKHTPSLIRRVIICTRLTYHDRALLAAHCVGNNIDIKEFVAAIVSVNRLAPEEHYHKLLGVCLWLHRALEERNVIILDKYFYYDIVLRNTFYLSGREYTSPIRASGGSLVAVCH